MSLVTSFLNYGQSKYIEEMIAFFYQNSCVHLSFL